MDIEEIKEAFLEESQEYMETLISNLENFLELYPNIDHSLMFETYRAAHSIKGTAGFLALEKITELAKSMETILMMLRDKELKPSKAMLKALLAAANKLTKLIDHMETSSNMDITEEIQELTTYI